MFSAAKSSGARGGIYRAPEAGNWETWLRIGFVSKPGEEEQEPPESEGVIEVAQTKPATLYEIPVKMSEPYHRPHLQNFFDAVRGRAELNCPADSAYKATVAALKVNEGSNGPNSRSQERRLRRLNRCRLCLRKQWMGAAEGLRERGVCLSSGSQGRICGATGGWRGAVCRGKRRETFFRRAAEYRAIQGR